MVTTLDLLSLPPPTATEERLGNAGSLDGSFALLLGQQQQCSAVATPPVALLDPITGSLTQPPPVEVVGSPLPVLSADHALASPTFTAALRARPLLSLRMDQPGSLERPYRKASAKTLQFDWPPASPSSAPAPDTTPVPLPESAGTEPLVTALAQLVPSSESLALHSDTTSAAIPQPVQPVGAAPTPVVALVSAPHKAPQLSREPSPAVALPPAGQVPDPVTALSARSLTTPVAPPLRKEPGLVPLSATTPGAAGSVPVETAVASPTSRQTPPVALLGASADRAASLPVGAALPPAESEDKADTFAWPTTRAVGVLPAETPTFKTASRPERSSTATGDPQSPDVSVQAAGVSDTFWRSAEAATQSESRSSAAPRASVVDQTGEVVARLRLELSPPLLGHILLDLREEGGAVIAHAVVDQPATGQMLRQVEAQVQRTLEDQGLKMGAFEVSCRGGGGQPDGEEAPARWGAPPVAPELPPAPERPQRHTAPPRLAEGAIDLYA